MTTVERRNSLSQFNTDTVTLYEEGDEIKVRTKKLPTLRMDKQTKEQHEEDGCELHLAVASVNGEVVKALIAAKADVNRRSDYGLMPLHYAAYYNAGKVILDSLLDARADVNAVDNEGSTVLHYTSAGTYAETDRISLAKDFIAKGAHKCLQVKNEHGETPMESAASHGFSSLAAFFSVHTSTDTSKQKKTGSSDAHSPKTKTAENCETDDPDMELEAIKLELANLEKREKTITQEATQKEVEQLKQQVLFLLQAVSSAKMLIKQLQLDQELEPARKQLQVAQKQVDLFHGKGLQSLSPTELADLVTQLESTQARVKQEQKRRDDLKDQCVICHDAKKTQCFVPCGHVCACEGCAQRIEDCPICRAKITTRVRFFT